MKRYSFHDVACSLFAINLYVPNVASPIRLQYLYSLLASVSRELQTSDQIKTYEDFQGFVNQLSALIPHFPKLEDYVPIPDWGQIKYRLNGKTYKIFYGGNLDNTYDFYYLFQVLHSELTAFYLEELSRNPIEELKLCLSLQDLILSCIRQDPGEELDLKPGSDLVVPGKDFWKQVIDFLDNFSATELDSRHCVQHYVKDLDLVDEKSLSPEAFGDLLAEQGNNLEHFFFRKDGRLYPILPRGYLDIIFSTWSKFLSSSVEKIHQDSSESDLVSRISMGLYRFLRERVYESKLFPFVSATNAQRKSSGKMFAAAVQVRDKLLLINLLPPEDPNKDFEEILSGDNDELKKTFEYLSDSPQRLILHGQGKIVEFSPKDSDKKLEPVVISLLPPTSLNLRTFSVPDGYIGILMFLDQFLGIIDEIKDADELVDYLEYREETQRDGSFSPFSSELDKFASFRDSSGVLIPGFAKYTALVLDWHWGTRYRYKSLLEFWQNFPSKDFFEQPRSWRIEPGISDGSYRLVSRTFRSYFHCLNVGHSWFYVNSPIDLLDYRSVKLADLTMGALVDSLSIYRTNVASIKALQSGQCVHIHFFPSSLLEDKVKFKHLQHLHPEDELWRIDAARVKYREIGVRVVFNEEKVINAFSNVSDRSTQVQLLIDVLKEIDSVDPDNQLEALIKELEEERTKKNRFGLFLAEKVSFPERFSSIIPDERSIKAATKELAAIVHALGVKPGSYSGDEAKRHIRSLIDQLVERIDELVNRNDFAKSLPIIIQNTDALIAEDEITRADIRTAKENDREVDYQMEARLAEEEGEFLHQYKNLRYILEKFVQLEPRGKEIIDQKKLRELLSYADLLLNLYYVSDFIKYSMYPSKLKIGSDFLVQVEHGANLGKMQDEYVLQRSQILLGAIGNEEDRVSLPEAVEEYLGKVDVAFQEDLGFGIRDLVAVLTVLSRWAEVNKTTEESGYYRATPEMIQAACESGIVDFTGKEKVQAILDFLTLDSQGLLDIEGDPNVKTVPVWEHKKRRHRYSIRPLVKIDSEYYWGPYSAKKSASLWAQMPDKHKLPSDINLPKTKKVLAEGHNEMSNRLEEKILEIVKRFTPLVQRNVSPFNQGMTAEDIGDIDVFAYIPDKNVLLNIEAKVIDQAYVNKDLKSIGEKLFGREKSTGEFKIGYTQRVEGRAKFLQTQGRDLAERFWKQVQGDNPKVVSIFVTQTSYWWTLHSPYETDVKFTEVQLLEDLINTALSE